MKRIVLVLLSIVVLSSCSEKVEPNFHLKGSLKGMRKGNVYLQKEEHGQLVLVDSVFMKGSENFEFKGHIESPEVFFLSTSRQNSATLPVFIEKKEINIEADMEDLLSAKIEGSENQELLDKFNEIIVNYNLKSNEIYAESIAASNSQDQAKLAELEDKFSNNNKRRTLYTINFAVSNADHEVSPYIALNYLVSSDVSVLDTISKSMSEDVKAGVYGKELSELVTQLKATKVGNKLPELVQKDTAGVEVKLENKKGFLLIDFWSASDIANSFPREALKELNNNYSTQLEIASIAVDTDAELWKKTITDENLNWLQLSDLKGADNEAVRKLAIRVLPENVLVNKEGIIVGRNLRSEEIEKLINQ